MSAPSFISFRVPSWRGLQIKEAFLPPIEEGSKEEHSLRSLIQRCPLEKERESENKGIGLFLKEWWMSMGDDMASSQRRCTN